MKLVLDTKDLTDGFFEETRLVGIMAPMKGYSFCWKINNYLGIDFRINHELEIQLQKKNRQYYFSVYEYAEPSTCLKHYLYNNKNDGEYLLPEFKNLDYLWLLKDDVVTEQSLQNLIQSIKAIKDIQLVVDLTHMGIKNREHLVF